ncbi:two-component system sensor histidine kinase NtrB [Allopontixanthobacter sediminis]|uniref:two-component system sensor histidine kinase NtrB n=1 Tax=Allopontixanthobacter sediminis TaxID=1689985 RepID=UPI002FCD9F7B
MIEPPVSIGRPVKSAPHPPAHTQLAGLIFSVLLLDRDLCIAEANPAAEALLGRSSKRLIGIKITDLVDFGTVGVQERLVVEDHQLVARGVAAIVGGERMRFNMTVSPMPTHPGWKVMSLSDGSRDDVSGEGEKESILGAPAVLAHEIKNPLAAIRGAGQLLARRVDEKDRPLAAMISDEVDRIARLVDRMQKLGSNTPDPVAPFNLHEAVRNAMATVRAGAPQNVTLSEEFDPSLPKVLASQDALEQVMINLLSNACDACSGLESGEITVKTRFVSGLAMSAIRLGRSVRVPIEITVIDNGPGVDPKLADRMFEPFVTAKKGGQGLGLALVKKLLADMDGRIGYSRDDRSGQTHFRINLPVSK